MKTYRVLVVLALVLFAGSAIAATGPTGAWSNVHGDNQLTSTHTHVSNTGPVMEFIRWEVWYPTEGGPWTTVVIDNDDNIYTCVNDTWGSFEKWDKDGNLIWTQPAPSGWGTDTTAVLGNDDGAGGYYYQPSSNGGSGDVLLKLDPADGTVLWTHVLGGGGYVLESAAATMDDAGSVYIRSAGSGYLHKVSDLGASATEDWTVNVNTSLANPDYAPWPTSVDPDQTKVYHVSGKPDYKLIALNATTGAVVWSTACGAENGGIWQDNLNGNPIVDDAGNVYAYAQSLADTSLNSGGITKYDGDTGVILWTYVTSNSGAFGCCPCTGALNHDQSRLYHEMGKTTIAVETATGIALWSLPVDACWQTNGSVIVDASNNPMVCGGGNAAMAHITDNGTYGSLDWSVDPLDKNLMQAYLDYCGMNSDSELVEGRCSPGWNGGLYLAVHYADSPPLAIISPLTIGPLEREIPLYGTFPYGLGIQFACKGAQGTVTYSILSGSLPPGLTLSSDGSLTGAVTAAAANQYTATVRANDGVLTDDKTYVIDIVDAPLQLGPGLPLGSVGNAYDGGLWIIGGTAPYTVAITAAKGDYVDATSIGTTGLSLNLSTGKITGVPSAISTATLEVTITDSVAAAITKDITVDVVDSRVWACFQRTKRRVGTSTLPAPESFPHNLTADRAFQYKSEDTWQWAWEMYQAPTFARLETDADGDGEHDGFMFISSKWASHPSTGGKNFAAAPYDVDPGGRYPNPLTYGGWVYDMDLDGWPGVHAPMWHPGLLKINGTYATRLYYTNDNSGTQGRFGCLNAQTGALLWSIAGDSDSDPWIDRRGFMALLENGDIVDKIGQHEFDGCQPTTTTGVWTEAQDLAWYMGGWSDTYGIIRDLDTEGKIIWTAGEVNTLDRDYLGPIFFNLGKPYWLFNTGYRGALTVFKLADEGELVLAQRGGPDPYYIGNRFTVRADSVQNVTVWTVGLSDVGNWYTGWTYRGTAPRACPVVDSTNNVYLTMDRAQEHGAASMRNPHIWCVDAAAAADNPTIGDQGGGNEDWSHISSDANGIKWETHLADANTHRIPAGPCLSRDQRTLYTVVVARATGFGGDFWMPVPLTPGAKCKLVALHTINGTVKWIKDLELGGLSGCDMVENGDIDWNTYTPMADSDGKVLCSTSGDKRQWWLTPGDPQNLQDPAFNTMLRPMAWCFRDTGTDATLLWTRAMSRESYRDRAGPGSYAVTPNYRLVYCGTLDPEWIGVDPAWTSGNYWWQDGVRLIHPDDIHITKMDYNPGANVTFTVNGNTSYDLEYADGNVYLDLPGALTWGTLLTQVSGAGVTSMTMTDDLTTVPMTGAFRFYRIRKTGAPFCSNEIGAAYKLTLNVGFAVRQFFISMPLIPDATATVASVIGNQLPYTGVKMDGLIANSGLYTRATYGTTTPGVWDNDYALAAGEGYWLDVGNSIPVPQNVILTGTVSSKTVGLSVTRSSFAVTRRWMGYCMPQPTTLAAFGLQNAITPFWAPTNEVRLLPLGTTVWQSYFFDGTNWRAGSIGGAIADATPLPCGSGILFIHNGITGSPDVLPLGTWYYKPPVAW